jgi:hypothetical protein
MFFLRVSVETPDEPRTPSPPHWPRNASTHQPEADRSVPGSGGRRSHRDIYAERGVLDALTLQFVER